MSGLLLILGLLAAAWAGATAYLYRGHQRRLFPGDGLPFGPFDGLRALGGEAVEAELDGQRLRYYRTPPSGPPAGPGRAAVPRAWVLHFHGNRHGARERFDFAERFSAWGYATVLAEYPGYAGDPAPSGQKQVLRNGLAMMDEVLRLAEGKPVFLFGESLGTAVATYVAVHRDAAGLLLSTPYTSLAAVAQSRYPWLPVERLVSDTMPAELWAPHVRCPVFIVHGTRDKVVPYALGRAQARRFAAAPEFVSIDGLGHSDIRDRYPELYWGGIQKFMDRCLRA